MRFCCLFVCLVASVLAGEPMRPLVLQTDFGVKDGAVSAMKGVAVSVDLQLPIFDLTHEIAPYNIAEASYRLLQAAPYWPAGTVFVSVVDPGVGTGRAAVVMRSRSGHYFVTPDNGTLSWVAESLEIDEVRRIDEQRHRRPGSTASHTFHGRDLFVLAGARLAAGQISFEEIGPLHAKPLVKLSFPEPRREGGRLTGAIPALDPNYGNVWTSIPQQMLLDLGVRQGDRLLVSIRQGDRVTFAGEVPFVSTFGDVPIGEPLLYLNSLLNLSLALNMGDFAEKFGVGAGADWSVVVERIEE